ncbi:MAG: hypothetical protein ACRDQD_01070, partial [Nocardioidaceae bacterium]
MGWLFKDGAFEDKPEQTHSRPGFWSDLTGFGGAGSSQQQSANRGGGGWWSDLTGFGAKDPDRDDGWWPSGSRQHDEGTRLIQSGSDQHARLSRRHQDANRRLSDNTDERNQAQGLF